MKRILPYEIMKKKVHIVLILLYAVVCLFLGIFLRAEMTGFYLLYVLSRFAFYLDAVLMITAYFCFVSSYRWNVDEVISASRGKGFYQTYILRIFLAFAALLQVTIIAALLTASISNDGGDYFLSYWWKSYLYNLLLPMVICLMAAYFLSLWSNLRGASVLLILFLLLISPLFSQIIWQRKPLLPVDQVFRALIRPFRILYENGTWAANPQLGLQTDASRGSLLLFYVLLFAVLAVRQLRKTNKLCKAMSVFFAGAGACMLVYACLPSGCYRIDESWDGTRTDDIYYDEQETGLVVDEPDYAVSTYDLSLSFGRTMKVDGTITIAADTAQNQFLLTLYHGYQVRNITGENTSVDWSKDGDYITVVTDEPVTELTLLLSYRDSHPIFYSYEEGASLPGWFPWYPMAGKHQVFLQYETVSSRYNTCNRIEPADITLHVDCSFLAVSNLEQIGDGVFSGCSDSITLIGGELCVTENAQVKDYLPLELVEESGESFEESVIEEWEEVCSQLEAYGISGVREDSTILLASRDMCRFYAYNDLAVFDDYILTWWGGISVGTVSVQLITKNVSESELANAVCGMGGLCSTPAETLENWLEILPIHARSDLLTQTYETLVLAQQAGEGEDVVKEIACFLCEGDADSNEQEFIEGLYERYAAD